MGQSQSQNTVHPLNTNTGNPMLVAVKQDKVENPTPSETENTPKLLVQKWATNPFKKISQPEPEINQRQLLAKLKNAMKLRDAEDKLNVPNSWQLKVMKDEAAKLFKGNEKTHAMGKDYQTYFLDSEKNPYVEIGNMVSNEFGNTRTAINLNTGKLVDVKTLHNEADRLHEVSSSIAVGQYKGVVGNRNGKYRIITEHNEGLSLDEIKKLHSEGKIKLTDSEWKYLLKEAVKATDAAHASGISLNTKSMIKDLVINPKTLEAKITSLRKNVLPKDGSKDFKKLNERNQLHEEMRLSKFVI